MALYPFHNLWLDFIGPINPPSKGCAWILVATELFTKQVKAVAMKKVTSSLVANFLKKNNVFLEYQVDSFLTMVHHS